MVVNRSAPAATVVPVLVYEDVSQALEFLIGAFGFAERLRAAGPGGRIMHAQLSVGNGAIIIGPQGGDFRAPGPSGVSLFLTVHVDDADAHCARAKAFGARIVQPPADQPFGERQYTALDPAGYRWTFSQSIADVAPESWGAIVAERT
jgi:uncharacterized glyoxalase superfamily protein PhnB